tara:strand:+ start:288 stop:506 length:219 start_codon:yes stop_codon:yes gene_type:complete
MKLITVIFLSFLFSNCTLNKNLTKNLNNNKTKKNELNQVLKNHNDVIRMSLDQYDIYIDDYTKKSKYPDISK